MKKLLYIITFLFLLISNSNADILKLQWNQVVSSDFAGWNLYQSVTSGGPWSRVAQLQYSGSTSDFYTTTISIPEIVGPPVTYYYVLTAFDTAGNESSFSNEVSKEFTDTTAPASPQEVTIIVEEVSNLNTRKEAK